MASLDKDKLVRTPWRWLVRILRRYDHEKRPRLTAWTTAVIVGVIMLFGILGYAIPALIDRG